MMVPASSQPDAVTLHLEAWFDARSRQLVPGDDESAKTAADDHGDARYRVDGGEQGSEDDAAECHRYADHESAFFRALWAVAASHGPCPSPVCSFSRHVR